KREAVSGEKSRHENTRGDGTLAEDAGGQAVRCKDANGKAAQRGEPHRTEDGKPAGSIRIRFERGEAVKFLSHLDLMKVFERAVRRSGLPVSYSKGFNPHPRMVL